MRRMRTPFTASGSLFSRKRSKKKVRKTRRSKSKEQVSPWQLEKTLAPRTLNFAVSHLLTQQQCKFMEILFRARTEDSPSKHLVVLRVLMLKWCCATYTLAAAQNCIYTTGGQFEQASTRGGHTLYIVHHCVENIFNIIQCILTIKMYLKTIKVWLTSADEFF